MPYLFLNCSDGRYSTRRLTDEEGRTSDRAVLVEERIYDAYSRHCDQDTVWQTLWNALDNEQAMRRHEKELQPLEEARRTIEWLKAELDRSQRMEKFYQDQARQNAPYEKQYVDITHVYPQPGCDLTALPSEWVERAQELLAKYRPDRMEDGLKYQGCCCESGHQLLTDEEAQKLRDAGFLVENDTEVM